MLDITLGPPDPDRAPEAAVGIVVRLAGAVDLGTAAALEQWFDATQELDGHVIIDLRDVDFVDSRGVRAFLLARRGDRRVTLTNVRPEVRRAFQMLGVADLLLDDGPS